MNHGKPLTPVHTVEIHVSDSELSEIVKCAEVEGLALSEYFRNLHHNRAKVQLKRQHEEHYLTLTELAQRLGLGVKILQGLANKRKIPYHKPGRRRLFLESEVRAAIEREKPDEEALREEMNKLGRRVMRERGLKHP